MEETIEERERDECLTHVRSQVKWRTVFLIECLHTGTFDQQKRYHLIITEEGIKCVCVLVVGYFSMTIVTSMMKTSLASSISNVNINQVSNNGLYNVQKKREGRDRD